MFARAEKVFGSSEAAGTWLTEECMALGFRSPQAVLNDEEGLERVLQLLMRIERGVFT